MTVARQLLLSAVPEPQHRAAASAVRLLVFNVQHASPGRARLQAGWIAGETPRTWWS